MTYVGLIYLSSHFNQVSLSTLQVLAITGDMSIEKDCEEAVKKTIDKFKKLDVLVPCAGILLTGPLETIALEDYDKQMNINCRSIVLLMKLCIPYLVESKGNIVNVSSVTGLRAVSIDPQYFILLMSLS